MDLQQDVASQGTIKLRPRISVDLLLICHLEGASMDLLPAQFSSLGQPCITWQDMICEVSCVVFSSLVFSPLNSCILAKVTMI